MTENITELHNEGTAQKVNTAESTITKAHKPGRSLRRVVTLCLHNSGGSWGVCSRISLRGSDSRLGFALQ